MHCAFGLRMVQRCTLAGSLSGYNYTLCPESMFSLGFSSIIIIISISIAIDGQGTRFQTTCTRLGWRTNKGYRVMIQSGGKEGGKEKKMAPTLAKM